MEYQDITPDEEPNNDDSANESGHNGTLTLLELLRHFAVYTNQKQSAMTYLLTLLREHQPLPLYQELPKTGRQLLTVREEQLPAAVDLCQGKYVHFGLENGILGRSPGILHRDADLLQFLEIYKKCPKLVPKPIRDRVFFYTT